MSEALALGILRFRWRVAWNVISYREHVAALPGPRAGAGGWERFVTRMAGLSQKAAAGALNFLHGVSESFAKPTELGFALCTSIPTSSQTGATIPEVTGLTGYERLVFTGKIAAAVEATKTKIKNNAEITGSPITAGSKVILGWAMTTKKTTEGNVVSYGSCTEVTVSSTNQPAKVANEGYVAEVE